jgi:excisionase family DNA binding protein
MPSTAKLAIVAPVDEPIRPEDILTPAELASRLKVPVTWIYEKTRLGGNHRKPLPVHRCGRLLRFDWAEVSAWLRQN